MERVEGGLQFDGEDSEDNSSEKERVLENNLAMKNLENSINSNDRGSSYKKGGFATKAMNNYDNPSSMDDSSLKQKVNQNGVFLNADAFDDEDRNGHLNSDNQEHSQKDEMEDRRELDSV